MLISRRKILRLVAPFSHEARSCHGADTNLLKSRSANNLSRIDENRASQRLLLCDSLILGLAVLALATVLFQGTGANAQSASWNQP